MGVNHDLGSLVPELLLASCSAGNSVNSKLSSETPRAEPYCLTRVTQIWVQMLPQHLMTV